MPTEPLVFDHSRGKGRPGEHTRSDSGPVCAPTMETFTEIATRSSGIALQDLPPSTTLRVTTEHSSYRIVVGRPGTREIVVEGGRFFPDPTPAHLNGATLGGSFLRLGSIVLGFCMEIVCDEGTIVTSSVQQIAVSRSAVSVPAIASSTA